MLPDTRSSLMSHPALARRVRRPHARDMRRFALVLLTGIALATVWPGGSAANSPSAPTVSPVLSTTALSPVTVGREAWVAVSVATLWRSPRSARVVDRPALANPAGIRLWLSRMTLTDRRGLDGRADTQTLLGDRIIVIARSGSWVKVVVPDQPTPLDRRGYPGWVPTAQLTAVRPVASALVATVVARTTYLRTDNASATSVTEISFGTRLPRVGTTGAWVRVVTPTGQVRRLNASAVAVRAQGAPALPVTGSDIVRTAQMFGGLPYLWAGRSGFGFDCSGLTSLDYRAHGVTIPRDADAQSIKGKAVSSGALRPGDLLFYATRGYVHHVSIYAGSGRMVQAPNTGSTVQTIAVSTPSFAREYAGARRLIG
jgi:gamma-D-glutamyl-L-lysine dipeptidyl-peptidase